ncbi:putative parvalbumin, EF-hand domain pair [Plasmopara halstedii]
MLGRSRNSDLTEPLHTGGASDCESAIHRESNSIVHRSQRRETVSSVGSDDFADKAAKLRIDFKTGRRRALKQQRFSREFRFNAQLALRVAFGVLIASSIQTRVSDHDPSKFDSKKWVLFPSWYYLGGLSYCAIAVIFTTGKTIGSTLMVAWHAILGVGMALVFSIVLFACMDVKTQDKDAQDPYKDYIEIDEAFSNNTYWVNQHNFFTTLPWMIIFTVVVLVCPFAATTKKFAVANNLFFILTVIDPADPLGGPGLKTSDDSRFRTANILRNLEVYFLIGIVGSFVSLAIMFMPYPIFAITRLRKDSALVAEDVLDLLNIIIDSYCFKNKNVDHMNFLKLKLQRKFEATEARHRRMQALLEDAWWEQSFGFHYVLKFHRPIMLNYVKVVGSLISDLRTLSYAMQLEKYEQLHFTYMKVLQREIYVIQTRSGDLLHEIAREVHLSSREVKLASISKLETQMETTLHRYRSTQNRTLRMNPITVEEMTGNMPLNLFLFSLNSFCSTMIEFQEIHNRKVYTDVHRIRSFVITSVANFFKLHHYTNGQALLSNFRGCVAIILGIFLSVYVYGYNSTVPSTIAYVMGKFFGGSFRATVNRVGGVVAGSVIPSVFQFFIAQICNPKHLDVVLINIVLFVWVCISMYVCYMGGYSSYAGLVSAFVSTGILMRQSDMCDNTSLDDASSIAISSYSSLAQTSVGIILFILVELLIFPKSALSLLRRNIQKTLKLQLEAFEALFGHQLTNSSAMNSDAIEHLRKILQVKIPAKLVAQAALLTEAQAEPVLWRRAYSARKYEKILENSRRLLNNNTLLLKLVQWFDYRVKRNFVRRSSIDIRDIGRPSVDSMSTHGKWQVASSHFRTAVIESFKTLEVLFSDAFLYLEPDQTAIFMQMKEAFRLADKDCSGEIDSDEVTVMLETIFSQSGVVKQGEIQKYVENFMLAVDKDKSGKVSFEEFVEALENGLKLEVEVYTRRKPKAPALVVRRENMLAAITEDDGGDDNDSDESKVLSSDKIQSNLSEALDVKDDDLRPPMPSRGSYRRVSHTSSIEMDKRASSAASFIQAMCREHDVLNVEEFGTSDIAAQMKTAYVEWLLEDQRYEKVSMEELLLLNCLVSGAEGIAKSISEMAEIVVSS